ncbi:hypothetical protein MicB006_1144 [Micromonospora sp. B006]|nr:hypothetical protein MicB006_1144 [Micromonospora sp. B006]
MDCYLSRRCLDRRTGVPPDRSPVSTRPGSCGVVPASPLRCQTVRQIRSGGGDSRPTAAGTGERRGYDRSRSSPPDDRSRTVRDRSSAICCAGIRRTGGVSWLW